MDNNFTEEQLNKLLENNNYAKSKADNILSKDEMLSEEYINRWDTIFFTDGSCIGKKKGTKFGGSGIYCHNANNKGIIPDKLKIIEKNPQEEVFIRKVIDGSNNIKFIGSKENEDFLKHTCSELECGNIGYCLGEDRKTILCSRHKLENCALLYAYDNFTPTNIRAEGKAILISLKTILFSVKEVDRQFSRNRLKKFIQEVDNDLITKNVYDINQLDIKKYINKDLELEAEHKFLIVSDSKFWIELITCWLDGWMRKNIVLEKKNNDIIIKIIHTVHQLSEANCYIKFMHVNGHQDKKKEEINFYHKGNIIADKLATHASQSKENKLSIL